MSVQEILMKPGHWSLNLRDNTPKAVRDSLRLETAGFGHVVITPARINDPGLTPNGLLAAARYTGVYRERPSELEMGGPGLLMWLGDEDGKGSMFEGPSVVSNQTFAQMVDFLVGALSSLTTGNREALGGSYSNTFSWMTRRHALDLVMTYFGAEYRANPNGTVDAGSQGWLYPTTTSPTAVVQRREGGRDLTLSGIRATKLEPVKDLDDYVTFVGVVSDHGYGTASHTELVYKNFAGNPLLWRKVVQSSRSGDGNETATAATLLAQAQAGHPAVDLSSDAYDIGADVHVGDTIWVWDPDRDLVDATNQVQYRGALIFPMKMRVFGSTWPIKPNFGVYFLDKGTTVIDLTDWVEWETGDVTLDVGARSRPLFDNLDTGLSPANVPGSILPGAWTDYTPGVTPGIVNPVSIDCAWVQIGKTVHGRFELVIGSGGFVSNAVIAIGLPVACVKGGGTIGTGEAVNAGVDAFPCHVELTSTTTFILRRSDHGGDIASNFPFTFGTSDALYGSFTYEAA